ncbi:MAG: hypothetical protein WC694_00965 [Candidatus Paceibacterota bacterium]|jgi:hypothetical protein
MRTNLIESYIDMLQKSLGLIKPPVEEEKLRDLYDSRNFGGMVSHIQETLRLDMKIRLGYVSKGGPKDAPAWVERPIDMPFYNSSEFRQTTVVVYLRKTFLRNGNFEEAVLAISHELSHIVLDAIKHPLRMHEIAVDLTAMLLGFRDFYVTGCQTAEPSISGNPYEIRSIGYLTPEEVSHAAKYMTFRK